MKVQFSLNDYVLVVPTREGWRILTEYFTKHGFPRMADEMRAELGLAHGQVRLQIWQLAHIFGPHMYNGNPNPPLEMEAEFP